MQLPAQEEANILRIIEDLNPEVYIVELKLSKGKRSVLSILVDTDEGIKIDEVAKISRGVGRYLDEAEFFDFPFTLEVSSPGVDRPLTLQRQYLKNTGRSLKVLLHDDTIYRGKLVSVSETDIQLAPARNKKGKKGTNETKTAGQSPAEHITVAFDDIKEAKVEITFK